MSTPGSRVPFPLRLAVRLLPKEVREEVLGDLLEHWSLRVSEQPWLARVAWTWRQQLSAFMARLRFSRRSEEQQGMAGRRNSGIGVSLLDIKLGVRMLRKQPMLTGVAVLALGLGIPASLGTIHVWRALMAPIPFDEGERIVGIRNWSLETNRPAPRALHDFVVWRQELTFERQCPLRPRFRPLQPQERTIRAGLPKVRT